MALEMRTETITPEQAAKYLKRNVDNYRTLSRAKVGQYAAEMKAGKWQLNGESIVFDETGKLKDGQHRLAAIMVAKVPVQMTVINGVAESVTIYDSGMTRSVRQIANAEGFEITSTEAAVATAIVGRLGKATRGVVLEYIGAHIDDLKRAYRVCNAGGKGLSRRVACVTAGYLMIRDGMKSFDAESFFRIFNSGNIVGTEGYEPSSALVARRIFEKYKAMPTNSRVIREQLDIMIQAMTDFQKGKKRQLNYQIKEPLMSEALLDRIRKKDGLEG